MPSLQLQEMMELFRHHGELTEEVLMKMVYRSLSQGERQFYEALKILKVSGFIEAVREGEGYKYKIKKKTKGKAK